MSSPRATVIISTYNWSTVLPYAIDSVLAQTMPDLELLVIGDGCTDDSEQVVARIDDPRVRWINLPVNTGHQSGPNNRGLQEANGEFIAYLGHDDLWLPHHLQCATDALDDTGAAVAHTLLMNVFPDHDTGIPVAPVAGLGSPPSCTVYRRDVTETIGGWGDYRTLDLAPEADLFRRAQSAGFDALFVPRLTAVKFPALLRQNVYRDRPCHEQSAWLQRIRTEADFETAHLVKMITTDQVTRGLPVRRLARILAEELKKRLAWRWRLRSGTPTIRWTARGAGIDDHKRYKGVK